MHPFKAFLIEQRDGKVVAGFTAFDPERLDPGEVTIRVAYSSINYKDALAATGAGRIVRRFPCIGGIDLAGHVLASRDPRFREGDPVLATGFDLGVAHHGGYAELARVPAEWVIPLPAGLSLFEAMALGTAGFTAALAIRRMEDNGLKPGNGPVIVTGATGGVGSLAIDMLAGLGYHVVALTGKDSARDYLLDLGAVEVLPRAALDLAHLRPLDSARWAGAVDTLGGPVLAWLCSTMRQAGTIASVGLAASPALETTVMPFILRGVSLLGVDSGYIGQPVRGELWSRLGADLKPRHLDAVSQRVGLDSLPGMFGAFLNARVRGRVVVAIGETGAEQA